MQKTVRTITRKTRRAFLIFGLQIALGHGWITQEEYEVTLDA